MHAKSNSTNLLVEIFQFPVQSVATSIFEYHDYSQPDATEKRNDKKYDNGSYSECVFRRVLISEKEGAGNISHGEKDKEQRVSDSSFRVASNILAYYGETERGL
jgi:hypothetical protein